MDGEIKQNIYIREQGRCYVCGAKLDPSNFHLAHVIPQRKHWMQLYGARIIHHELNMRATCPNDLCNNAVSLGNNRLAVDKHAAVIEQAIKGARND
jgi:hypothetical protein